MNLCRKIAAYGAQQYFFNPDIELVLYVVCDLLLEVRISDRIYQDKCGLLKRGVCHEKDVSRNQEAADRIHVGNSKVSCKDCAKAHKRRRAVLYRILCV